MHTAKDRSELEKHMRAFARSGGRVVELDPVEKLQEREAEIDRQAREGARPKVVDLGPLARRFALRAGRTALGK